MTLKSHVGLRLLGESIVLWSTGTVFIRFIDHAGSSDLHGVATGTLSKRAAPNREGVR
jgi:hypothetical protein